MASVRILALLATTLYAVANVFGAWAVVRRKPWVAALFMLAATVLVVASVALGFALAEADLLLLVGLILATLASFLNAYIVIGKIVWWRHLVRLGVAAAIYLLAVLGSPH